MRTLSLKSITLVAVRSCIAAVTGKGLGSLLCLILFLQTANIALGVTTTPVFVQEKDNQVTSGQTSRATFKSSTTAGNLIAVYVIWDNTGTASVSDSLGNTYTSAVGPTRWSNSKYNTQIFYAISVGSGVNTVTATFATKITVFGIVYAHEYAGINQTAPLDVTAAAAGISGSLNSGSATTTSDRGVLFAGGVSASVVTAPGTGYTVRSSAQGNMTADRMVSGAGSYSATAGNSGGAWAMQMAAFRGAGSGTSDTTSPTVPARLSATVLSSSQVALSWTASTDPDNTASQITYGVYRNGVRITTTAAGATSWTDTGLVANSTYSYSICAYDPSGNASSQTAPVQVKTSPLADTSAPTVPTGLSVTTTTTSTVSLAWAASTDGVGVAGYKIYRGAVQVGTSGTATYTDTGLTPSTTYSYTVSAYDAAGNNSAQSSAVQAKTKAAADTTPPTVPSNLSVSGTTTSTVSLAWTASTDGVGVAGYTIYRGGVQVGTSSSATYTDAGLTPSTTYSYTVSAYDAAGNNSAQSFAVQAKTKAAADTTPPTVPSSLSVTGTTTSTVSLIWGASSDDVGVTGYKVYRGGVQVAAPTSAAYTDTGLAPSTTYSYTVSAYDAAGNNSAQTLAIAATTAAQDTQSPSISITSPGSNQAVSGTTTIMANATDNVGIAGVQFQVDGVNLGVEVTTSPYATSWNTSQSGNGSHVLTAIARDAAGNRTTSAGVPVTINNASLRPYSTNFSLTENPISEGGNWINGRAVGLDWGDVQTTPGLAFGTNIGNYADPTAILAGSWGPDQMAQATVHSVNQNDSIYEEVELRLRSTITAHSNTGYEINFRCSKTGNAYSQIVRWNGPLGNFTYLWANGGSQFGVANGDVVKATMIGNVITVYINGVQIAQVSDSTYASGSPGMGFYLQGGTTSLTSDYGFSSFMASDQLTSDTIPPSTPANMSAKTISSSQIDLSWNASTDNVGVAGYRVYRNSNLIGTTAALTYSDKTVVPGPQYIYTVSAFDVAGNESSQSAPAAGAVSSAPDSVSPQSPTALQASNITSTTMTISWSPSSDNVAVAGYQVFRNGSMVGTTSATSYAGTGLTPSTTYYYSIAAYDSSNNLSAQSQQLAATTTAKAVTAPSFVQVNQNQISNGSTTSVALHTPTVAGNTLVIYVIWNNAGSVALTDSRGNTFVNVGGPVTWSSGYSAQIFYAANIVGGTDTVTATFRTAVTSFGVVYAHEYAGISGVNPVDVTVSASGTGSSLNSGAVTTTATNDLIFGAGVSDNMVTAAGSGFTSRDLVYGNVTEDRAAAAIGSYSATATHNGRSWGMQVVAFRAAN